MVFTRDEKLMLIVALGESTQEMEEFLEIPPEVQSYGVFLKILEGKFKLTNPQVVALIQLLEFPLLKGRAWEALDQTFFGYDSPKYSEEDFEKLSLKYADPSPVYNSLLTKLKEEL